MEVISLKQKRRLCLVLCIIMCIITSTVGAGAANIQEATYETDVSITSIEIDKDEKNEETAAETPKFTVDAKSAILIEAETGKVLYAFNENEPFLLPASQK